MTKYNNKPIDNADGHFDSQKEWERWVFLKEKEGAGEISELRRQVNFVLIPKQVESVAIQLKTKTKIVERTIERECSYRADFVYVRSGVLVAEDLKGIGGLRAGKKRFSTITPDFVIKKKLMLYVHGIRVKIVQSPTLW